MKLFLKNVFYIGDIFSFEFFEKIKNNPNYAISNDFRKLAFFTMREKMWIHWEDYWKDSLKTGNLFFFKICHRQYPVPELAKIIAENNLFFILDYLSETRQFRSYHFEEVLKSNFALHSLFSIFSR